jgi:hypothetical protein
VLTKDSQSRSRPFASHADERVADAMRPARRLTIALLILMAGQAFTGLLFDNAYRDIEWIKATWFGNDWITLVAAIPLLAGGLRLAGGGSVRGLLLWLGLVGYALYNYAFYLFGAALNAFFLLYVAALVLAAIVLILVLSQIHPSRVSESFRSTTPVRAIGAALVFIGIGLSTVWIAMWGAYVFAGRPTSVEPEAFKLVAALDLSLMVPALTVGGVLVWNRIPWGFIIAAIASIQSALYLLVLAINSMVLVRRDIVSFPGELRLWGALTVLTTTIALSILTNIRSEATTR